MIDFSKLPVKLIDIRDCVWPEHDIDPEHLKEPERRREIDDNPISVELLVTGNWFVHDGRHRLLRSRARGEHQISAYTLTHSNKGVLEQAEVQENLLTVERMCPCGCGITHARAVKELMHLGYNRDQAEAMLDGTYR